MKYNLKLDIAKPIIEWNKVFNMNRFIFFIMTCSVFFNISYQNISAEQDESDSLSSDSVQWIDINDLVPNTISLQELSEEQVVQVKKIHETFSEVNPNTLEEWIDGFEVDLNPDNEIQIWLNIGGGSLCTFNRKSRTKFRSKNGSL